jgi:hypothetical protein
VTYVQDKLTGEKYRIKIACSRGRVKVMNRVPMESSHVRTQQRNRSSARPSAKEQCCTWSISFTNRDTNSAAVVAPAPPSAPPESPHVVQPTPRWRVSKSSMHTSAHNHELDPKLVAFTARRDNVPEEIRQRIIQMKADKTPSLQMWARVASMYKERGETAPDFIVDDLLALSRENTGKQGPAMNDAQAAICELQQTALNDRSHDNLWVVSFR